MTGVFPSRALLAMVLGALLLGCAAKPPEKPIVLRPHRPERRLAPRPPPPVTPAAVPAPADAPLSPEEKENLFRGFETYLSRSAKPNGTAAGSQP